MRRFPHHHLPSHPHPTGPGTPGLQHLPSPQAIMPQGRWEKGRAAVEGTGWPRATGRIHASGREGKESELRKPGSRWRGG